MQFAKLIQTSHWKNIKRALLEAYPDLDTAGYKHVFTQLRTLEPVENTGDHGLDQVAGLEPRLANLQRVTSRTRSWTRLM